MRCRDCCLAFFNQLYVIMKKLVFFSKGVFQNLKKMALTIK